MARSCIISATAAGSTRRTRPGGTAGPGKSNWPAYGEYRNLKQTRVVLATAHLDHDPSNSRPGNLRALCQRCHMIHDRPEHRRRIRTTILMRRALAICSSGLINDEMPPAHAWTERHSKKLTIGLAWRRVGKAAAGAGVAGMIDQSEGRFLTYIARRIDCEVAHCQRCEQSEAQTRVNIDRLATCALEVLGSKDSSRPGWKPRPARRHSRGFFQLLSVKGTPR